MRIGFWGWIVSVSETIQPQFASEGMRRVKGIGALAGLYRL